MTIFGVALLAICTLVGVFLGDALGVLLHVKSNVGGVGLAMALLIAARIWLEHAPASCRTASGSGWSSGVHLSIPIVVAMAAQQNVVSAISGGPMVVVAAVGTVALCLASVALLGRSGPRLPMVDEAQRRAGALGDPG